MLSATLAPIDSTLTTNSYLGVDSEGCICEQICCRVEKIVALSKIKAFFVELFKYH